MTTKPARIHAHRSLLDIVYHLADAGAIVLALMAALRFDDHSEDLTPQLKLLSGLMAILGFFLAAEVSGLYRNWRGVLAERELLCSLLTWIEAAPLFLAAAFAADYLREISRSLLLAWLVSGGALVVSVRAAVRLGLRFLRRRGWGSRGYAIVGVNRLAFQLAENIDAAPHLGLKFLGFYDDRPAHRTTDAPAEFAGRLGNIDELVDAAREGKVHMVYIAFPLRAEKRIKDVLDRLSDTTASVYVAPDFFVFELLHSRWTTIGGLPVVSVFENPFYGVDGLIKRMADVCLAGVMLLAAALPMTLIAAAIKLTSPGPVFFRQKRYGLDGREIGVWKFRSMKVTENGPVVTQARERDPRVTPLGRLLRKNSLDELPQLFNVLLGSMSLVGPRPHASAHNEEYRKTIPGYMLRHKVKPGITGLAQVSGARGETDTLAKMQKRIDFDHQYIREWSPWLDLKILVKTVFTVLKADNAY